MLLLKKSVDFTLGNHVLLRVPHSVHTLLTRARTQHLSSSRRLKYEDSLLNNEVVTLERSPPLNLASLVPIVTDPIDEHDCTALIEDKPQVREQIHKVPLQDGLMLFIDGSSLVLPNGQRAAGFSVIQYCAPDLFKVLLSVPLVPPVSSQVAELCAAIAALHIAGCQSATVWTDSMYVFSVAHDYYALWVEREFMTAAGTPIKNASFIVAMLEALQLPCEVAIVHCRGHQKDDSLVTCGNNLADQVAQAAACGITVNTEYRKVMNIMPSTEVPLLDNNVAELQHRFMTNKDVTYLNTYKDKFAKDERGVWIQIPTRLPVALNTLQWYLIRLLHHPAHIGARPMIQYLRNCWWCPGVSVKCSQLVARCQICAEFNPGKPIHMVPAIAPMPSAPFSSIQLDFIHLPAVNKMQWALVIIDRWSGWPEVWPTARDDSITVVKILIRDVIPRWGHLSFIDSDQGSHFCSEIMSNLCKALGISQQLHCPRHPQSSGRVERLNMDIKIKLGKVCAEKKLNWIEALPYVLLAIRAMPGRLGLSPFELLFGRAMPLSVMGGGNSAFVCNDDIVLNQVKALTDTMKALYPRIKTAFPDPPSTPLHDLSPGEFVYIRNWTRKTSLHPRWLGPKEVVLTTNTAVKVAGVPTWVHCTHVKRIKDFESDIPLPSVNIDTVPSDNTIVDLSPDPIVPRYNLRSRN